MGRKIFEKVLDNSHVDLFENFGFFSDFQCSFRSSHSTADLQRVVLNRTAGAFNRSGATRPVTLDIFKIFNRVWYPFLINSSLMEFKVGYLPLLFSVITTW